MKKLGWPTIFCNALEVAPSGEITGYKMRCQQSKLTTVKALQSIGYETIASGDSYNDLGASCSRARKKSKPTTRSCRPMRNLTICSAPSNRRCEPGARERPRKGKRSKA